MHGSTCPKCGAASDGSSKSCGSCGAVRYLSPLVPVPYMSLSLSTLDKWTNFTLPTIVLPQLSCVMTYKPWGACHTQPLLVLSSGCPEEREAIPGGMMEEAKASLPSR
ncbi:hypothetical protein QBC45DRAFT_417893 [Copromyces sp. CBS 386.78]|nr:hypothetical protein QBC45DRAFT_417893 [Copromyces sp. CBS 386.78]